MGEPVCKLQLCTRDEKTYRCMGGLKSCHKRKVLPKVRGAELMKPLRYQGIDGRAGRIQKEDFEIEGGQSWLWRGKQSPCLLQLQVLQAFLAPTPLTCVLHQNSLALAKCACCQPAVVMLGRCVHTGALRTGVSLLSWPGAAEKHRATLLIKLHEFVS